MLVGCRREELLEIFTGDKVRIFLCNSIKVSTNVLSKSNPTLRRGIKEYMHRDNSRKRLRFALLKASFIHMQGLSSNLIL
jgi:hypothetical protein